MTRDQFIDMAIAQDMRCAICRDKFTDTALLTVDHDHGCCPKRPTCGCCNRSLLCIHCNAGIGNFRDDPARLLAAIEYLKETSS